MPAGDAVGGPGGLGGLGGLANRIVEAMGSLLGSGADPAGTADAFDDDEDPFQPGDVEHIKDKPDAPQEVKEADKVPDTAAAKPAEEAIPVADPPPPVADPPAPAPVADPPAPPPVAEPPPPATETSTPCEIAADQLPQAGR
jgi:hypothetical protein